MNSNSQTSSRKPLEAVGDLVKGVVNLRKLFEQMPALMTREHEAIKQSDLETVESLVQEKLELSSKVDQAFKDFKISIASFADCYAQLSGQRPSKVSIFSDVFQLIEDLITRLGPEAELCKQLSAKLEDLKLEFESFLSWQQQSKDLMAVNRLVLAKLLAKRQENYQFWQEVTADFMAAYDQKGQKRAKAKHGSVSIKA